VEDQDRRSVAPLPINTAVTGEIEVPSLGGETIGSPAQGLSTATRPNQQTVQAPAFATPIEAARPAPKWQKNILAAVVGAILLALIAYMAWRSMHRITPGLVLVAINQSWRPVGASPLVVKAVDKLASSNCGRKD
jgi:hypothetical protein